jgi:ubiquitin C-terminal hydrolase
MITVIQEYFQARAEDQLMCNICGLTSTHPATDSTVSFYMSQVSKPEGVYICTSFEKTDRYQWHKCGGGYYLQRRKQQRSKK